MPLRQAESLGEFNAPPAFTPTYDSNGNLTNDNIHNYAWDADGHAIAMDVGLSDAVNITYDALGRMVEQNRSGTYTQIAYSATGRKFALMRGSTLQKAMVPLSGQSQAIYNSSGLLYYAHPDLLGSIRLATTPLTRLMYFDTAYAPFGETYASAGTLDPAYTGQVNDTAHREDTAGGLYDFPLREYSIQGRWPSPDPEGVSATCTKNPQTQNRYSYVSNNPLSYVDPLGAQGCNPEDPNCGNCDPSTDPFCGVGPPTGGGGRGGGSGSEGWPGNIWYPRPLFPPGLFNSLTSGSNGESIDLFWTVGCGCDTKSGFGSYLNCLISSILFSCKPDYGPEGCQETTYSSPPPIQGDDCAQLQPPHIFLRAWSCAGDVACCRNKKSAFTNACFDAPGQVAINVQPIGSGAMEGAQCCKQPQPKPKQ